MTKGDLRLANGEGEEQEPLTVEEVKHERGEDFEYDSQCIQCCEEQADEALTEWRAEDDPEKRARLWAGSEARWDTRYERMTEAERDTYHEGNMTREWDIVGYAKALLKRTMIWLPAQCDADAAMQIAEFDEYKKLAGYLTERERRVFTMGVLTGCEREETKRESISCLWRQPHPCHEDSDKGADEFHEHMSYSVDGAVDERHSGEDSPGLIDQTQWEDVGRIERRYAEHERNVGYLLTAMIRPQYK